MVAGERDRTRTMTSGDGMSFSSLSSISSLITSHSCFYQRAGLRRVICCSSTGLADRQGMNDSHSSFGGTA